MNRLIRNHLALILLAVTVLLAACGSPSVRVGSLEFGIEPTSTPIPTPTLTPTPAPTLETYRNDEYGFAFDYLSTWTLSEEPHFVRLQQDNLQLTIGYRWATETVSLGHRTGMPAGTLIYSAKVVFLGNVIPGHTLEYERKAKAVFYGEYGQVEAGDLQFNLYLEAPDGRDYEALDIPELVQAEVKVLLESFRRIQATGQPPAPSPTPPPVPTRTPTPAPSGDGVAEGPRASETVVLDMTWRQYTNYQMGFTIKYPAAMVHFLGACKWNEEGGDRSFRPDPAPVPVKVFEDGNSVYIAPEYVHELGGEWKQSDDQGQTRTSFSECNQEPNSLALLNDPERPWFSSQMWKLVAVEVQSDDELDAFIKDRYGAGCSLGEKVAASQDGVYDVRIEGDGKDLGETQCPLNFATVVKYYSKGNRVIAWDMGQAASFYATPDWMESYDQEMRESFRFLTGTESAVQVVGWYGSVHSAPEGSGYDDYLSVLPTTSEGVAAAEVGLIGQSPADEAAIAEMRDKEPPDKFAHFWGTLLCGVDDYGGCVLTVSHMRPDGPGPTFNPDPVEGWEGTIITSSAWAQIDDAFVLAGDYPVHYGIWSENAELDLNLQRYRNSGYRIRVWGQLLCGVPDAGGCQIQVQRFEEAPAAEEPPAAESPAPEAEWASYDNEEYGFSFQYPATWALEEVPGQELPEEPGRPAGRCSNAIVLSQGTLAIQIQYLRGSEGLYWCGVGTVASILEPTHQGQVTVMGQPARRNALEHGNAVKAVDVHVDDVADLFLQIMLRDTSDTAYTAPEMKALPESAVADLDRILSSFERFQ